MEALLIWIFQNISWEVLKKALPENKQTDLRVFRQALADAQDRNKELESDRAMLERLIEQRDVAFAELREAKRRIRDLEKECYELRLSKKRRTSINKQVVQ